MLPKARYEVGREGREKRDMAGKRLTRALVLAGAPAEHVDILYATGFMAPDPVVYVQVGAWRALMVPELEYGRACSTCVARNIQVFTPRQTGLAGSARRDPARWILALLAQGSVQQVRVPAMFPAGLLRRLEQAGIEVEVLAKEPFPRRRQKSAEELRQMREVQQAAVLAMRAAIGWLAESCVDREGLLRTGDVVLTSEMLQRRIAEILLRHDCYCGETIVACGAQGADPHARGNGPLQAEQPIVIDIFPRHQGHGYCGDITRTVLKGKASRALKHMYLTVKGAHTAALRKVRAGVSTRAVHGAAVDGIARRGYPTGRDEHGFHGFIHGTGHGVGLAIHEAPSVSNQQTRLRAGDVITIEPGLYYPGLGGIRLEDTVVVTPQGWRYLVPCEKQFEIG